MKGYQLKITIKGSKPPVWRRVVVPESVTFRTLHQVIQEAFGWSGYHLHEFEFGKLKMLVRDMGAEGPENQGGYSLLDENEKAGALLTENQRFIYTYDFKDRWEHQILFEKEIEYDGEAAEVVKAKGGNLPENCGGIKAYYELEETGTEEVYDLEAVNQRLKEKKEIPEQAAEKPKTPLKVSVPAHYIRSFVNPADPCPCGSGKRYRQCCGRKTR